ncbi:hypothetical protein, partial [Nitratifractor sp.]
MASQIAQICNIQYVDTDSLYWRRGWDLSSDEEVVSQLPLLSNEWSIDGNFVAHRDTVWERADS